jgi:hypothetical protein
MPSKDVGNKLDSNGVVRRVGGLHRVLHSAGALPGGGAAGVSGLGAAAGGPETVLKTGSRKVLGALDSGDLEAGRAAFLEMTRACCCSKLRR